MALRLTAIICVTSFLLGIYHVKLPSDREHNHSIGILFTHWIADSLTLWKTPITDVNLWTAAKYYNILLSGPIWSGYALLSAVAFGAICIFWSLRDGEAGNIMFDGGSICTSHLLMFCMDADVRVNQSYLAQPLLYM